MRVRIPIAREVELDEIFVLQRQTSDWIGAVFSKPGGYDLDVEDCASCCADGVLKRLERSGAEVKWKAFERASGRFEVYVRASAGGVGV